MHDADVSPAVRYTSSNVHASPIVRLSLLRRPSPPDVDDLWNKRRFVRYGFPGISLARPTPDAAPGGGNPAPNAALTTGITAFQSGIFLAAHARASSQGDKALPQLFAPLGRVILHLPRVLELHSVPSFGYAVCKSAFHLLHFRPFFVHLLRLINLFLISTPSRSPVQLDLSLASSSCVMERGAEVGS